jgi:fructokinase
MGVSNLISTLSPQRIILGGGIMKHPDLLSKVQSKVEILLNRYIRSLDSIGKICNYLVRPALEDTRSGTSLSGVLGAIVLARRMNSRTD